MTSTIKPTMKPLQSIATALVLFSTLMLISCNSSVKGKWSEADKQAFRKDVGEVKELSTFGENKTKWIDCYLSKCEANYASYAETDKDEKGVEKIALTCNDEVLSNGSIQGKWSETDKSTFRKDMEGVEELASLGENKTPWIECYLSKCEAKYASYYHANMDEKGCGEIATACTEEIN